MVVELERRRLYQDQIIHSGTRIKEVEVEPFILVGKSARGGAGGSSRPSCLGPIISPVVSYGLWEAQTYIIMDSMLGSYHSDFLRV